MRRTRPNTLPNTLTATLVAGLLAAGCATTGDGPGATPVETAGLRELAATLTGHFSSAAQAERDDDFLHIELRAVRVWPERTDGIWLYVEQAAGWALERPYRQRLYHLTEPEPGVFVSAIHRTPGDDPLDFAGAWATPEVFDAFGPGDAEPRTGCALRLVRDGDAFVGKTSGRGCESSIGDAKYATSSAILTPTYLLTWDRGWSAPGEQAWGAETGPYLFERQD